MVPLMAAGVPFYTDGSTGMVDVRDVVRAMADLADSEKAVGERFIVCGANISYREFLTLSAQAAGKKPPHIRAGCFLLGMAWRGAWLLGKLTGKTFLFTGDLAQVLQKRTCYNTEKLRNTIGFEFIPIGQTIDRIVKQYLAQKNG
jgi:nucleoside-diphosphate-sugar epimerase